MGEVDNLDETSVHWRVASTHTDWRQNSFTSQVPPKEAAATHEGLIWNETVKNCRRSWKLEGPKLSHWSLTTSGGRATQLTQRCFGGRRRRAPQSILRS